MLPILFGAPISAFANDTEYIDLSNSEFSFEIEGEYLFDVDDNPEQYEDDIILIEVPDETDIGARYLFVPIISFGLEVGTSYRIFAYVHPLETQSQEVIWSSSDENIATIDADGTVTAISEGTAILTVQTPDGDLTEITTVFVVPAEEWYEEVFGDGIMPLNNATEIRVTPASSPVPQIRVGGTMGFYSTVVPTNTVTRQWVSTATSVATVHPSDATRNALVRGVSAGQTTIRASVNGQFGVTLTASRTVRVVAAAPAAPTNLRATETTTNSIRLAWNAPPQGATSYYVYLNGSRIGSVSTAGANITNLLPNTSYRFNVRARNSGGTSGLSSALNVSTRQNPTLSISPTQWDAPAGGGTTTAWVSSNISWSESSQAWITVSPRSGAGSREIFITASANNTTSARSGTVTITGGGLTRSITVRQPAAPHTVTLNRNGGTTGATSFTIQPGSSVMSGYSNPTRAGYTFNGYWTAATGGSQVINASGALNANVSGFTNANRQWIRTITPTTLVARWTPITRTLTFSTGTGGTWSSIPPGWTRNAAQTQLTRTVNAGVNWNTIDWPTVAHLSRPGYVPNILPQRPTGNVPATGGTVSWTVTWVRAVHTVTFNHNFVGSPANITRNVQHGGSVGNANMPNPTRAGFTFAGWFNTSAATGGTQFLGTTTVNNNTTVWARWTQNAPVTRTVTFNLQGGNIGGNSANVTRTVNNNARLDTGTPAPAMPTPVRTGHNFVGWFTTATGNVQRQGSFIVTENLTLHAQWTPVAQTTHTVFFNLAGGTRTGGGAIEQQVPHGGNATLPIATRAGHTFAGWAPAGNYNNVTSSRTIIAQWTPIGTGQCTGCGLWNFRQSINRNNVTIRVYCNWLSARPTAIQQVRDAAAEWSSTGLVSISVQATPPHPPTAPSSTIVSWPYFESHQFGIFISSEREPGLIRINRDYWEINAMLPRDVPLYVFDDMPDDWPYIPTVSFVPFTLLHEIGHLLGLYHPIYPHNVIGTRGCRELAIMQQQPFWTDHLTAHDRGALDLRFQ